MGCTRVVLVVLYGWYSHRRVWKIQVVRYPYQLSPSRIFSYCNHLSYIKNKNKKWKNVWYKGWYPRFFQLLPSINIILPLLFLQHDIRAIRTLSLFPFPSLLFFLFFLHILICVEQLVSRHLNTIGRCVKTSQMVAVFTTIIIVVVA